MARPGRNELPLAWQVLEILGDQRIPYEEELKRFRAEGDFLVRALTDLVSQCRSQIHKLEHDLRSSKSSLANESCHETSFKRCIIWRAGKKGSD